MRKYGIFLFIVLTTITTNGQLVVNFQSPPTGLLYKPQLWTMVVTNTSAAPILIHAEVVLNETSTSQQVLTGTTNTISVPPGTRQLNPSDFFPVQYNSLSPSYVIDNDPNGLLPIGQFEACYTFFKNNSDSYEQILEQCQDVTVEPLSPPQLMYPFDATAIEETNPQFSWLAPLPLSMFSNLSYDFTLVEMNPNQAPADALDQNVPIYQRTDLPGNTLLYPLSAPALQYEKQYAWKIVAKNNSAAVASSEVWQFTLKHYGTLNQASPTEQAYVKLKKNPEAGYAIFINEFKFDYFNETTDSLWNVKVTDLSLSSPVEHLLSLDSTSLKPGQNLIRYKASEDPFFINKHFYQLELFNSRKEVWRLKFEYLSSEETNY